MKTKIFIFILLSLTLSGWSFIKNQTTQKEQTKNEITQILLTQENAWNKGDLEAYMQGYWNSDSLKFLSNNRVTHGWTKTLDKYKKGYPDMDAIGELKFTIVSIDILSEDLALMIGHYNIMRKDDESNGYFSLIWRKINDKWVIVFDHSS